MKSYKQIGFYFIPILLACNPQFYSNKVESRNYKIQSERIADTLNASSVEAYLKPFRDSLNMTMNRELGTALADFNKEKAGGSLGQLVAFAMFYQGSKLLPSMPGAPKEADGSITNSGGLRINQLPKGIITRGKIFELLPFENEMVLLKVPGGVLRNWLEHINSKGGWPIHGPIPFQKKNGIYQTNYLDSTQRFDIHTGDPYTQVIRKTLSSDTTQTFYIWTSDYIAEGGDLCSFLIPFERINTGIKIRDVVLEYIRSCGSIHPNTKIEPN
jgi:2',3'-cyclic-nucleotide 2'-phosphodiesterase (5'-nucleotidase family)